VSQSWEQVWAARRLDSSLPTVLSQLLAADGFDTSFGELTEPAWLEFVNEVARRLGIGPESSVFEVGCGAGAFLYGLHQLGCSVSGIDKSAALIACAREAMPHGTFEVADAAGFECEWPADAVIACGVFLYFHSLEYASRVLRRMVANARGAVAVLDVPDAALEREASAWREQVAGGREAYAERYAGLTHLYYDRTWLRDALSDAGVHGVAIERQHIAGYPNGRFRFNAFGFIR
jgi:trans-aconitate methyltransferase